MQAKIGNEKGLETALWSLRGKDADISSEAAEIIVTFLTSPTCSATHV